MLEGRYGGLMRRWRDQATAKISAVISSRPVLAKLAANAGWQVLDRVLRMGVGVIVSVWIARALGPLEFGELNWMLALAGLMFSLTGMGLGEIMVRELVRNPDAGDELLGTGLAMQLGGGTLGMAIFFGAVMVLRPGETDILWLALAVAPMLLFQVSDILRYFYDARLESRYHVWVSGASFGVVTLARIVLLLNGAPLIAFAIVSTAEVAMAAAGMAAIYRSQGHSLGGLRVRLGRAGTLFRESWPMLLSGTAVLINMKIDAVMLGRMSGDVDVGIYTAAVRLSELWYFLPMVIAASAFPALTVVHGKDAAAESWQWRRLYALLFWMSIMAGFVASVISDPLVRQLFGADYAAAGPVLAVHIWGGVPVCIGLVWSRWMLLEGQQKIILFNQLLGAVLNVGLNLLLIPRMGVMGAAVATLLSYWISMLVSLIAYRPLVTLGHFWVVLRPWTLVVR